VITFDYETWASMGNVPGACTPRAVCLAFYDGSQALLYHRDQFADWYGVLEWALQSDRLIGNQTIGFDWRVALRESLRHSKSAAVHLRRLVFQAYQDNRIRDPQVSAMLGSIQMGEPMSKSGREGAKLGGFSLGDMCKRYLGRAVTGKGEDAWRLRYHELDQIPLHDWPEEARDYPKRDVRDAYDLIVALNERYGLQPGEHRNVRGAFSLQLMESWGVRTDPEYTLKLKRVLMHSVRQAKTEIRKLGGWIRDNDKQNRKAFHARIDSAWQAIGEVTPRNEVTPKNAAKGHTQGSVVGERPVLQSLIDKSPPGSLPDLQLWVDIGRMTTDLSTFIKPVERGAVLPINARWNILVESERLSCRQPNLTNQPTHSHDGLAIRPCFVAREGWVYASADLKTAELCGLSQVTYDWFGASVMRDTLIAEARARASGSAALDLHSKFACRILNVDEATGLRMVLEEHPAMMAKPFGGRDIGKKCNFGLAGYMQARTFALTCLREKFDLTMGGKLGDDPIAVSEWLRDAWLDMWLEMPGYFDRNRDLIDAGGGRYTTVTSWSKDGDGIVRGNVKMTDLCNHWFQNIVARIIKEALWKVSWEAYNCENSPLWGCRPVIAPHDEIVAEAPAHRAGPAADRLAAVLVECASRVAPDVPWAADPALSYAWYKGAKEVRDDAGGLIPWIP
jgi:hypothetical protein